MENNNGSLLKATMNYGLITGLIVIVYSLLLYIIGLHLNQYFGYLTIVIMAACIFIFTKQYRDKQNEGFISFGKAFQLGILIGVFAAILLSFFSYIEVTFIDPTIVEKQLDIQREKMLAKGISEEQVEMGIQMAKKMMTPAMLFIVSILSFTFWAAIISLITSAILKKNSSN
ncbi:MAG TPA: DUF4199 domain-containing protein [Bacteroidales bacterium]|nr:DUF4199 domain-containing protein [Bacteroidales bacterium]